MNTGRGNEVELVGAKARAFAIAAQHDGPTNAAQTKGEPLVGTNLAVEGGDFEDQVGGRIAASRAAPSMTRSGMRELGFGASSRRGVGETRRCGRGGAGASGAFGLDRPERHSTRAVTFSPGPPVPRGYEGQRR